MRHRGHKKAVVAVAHAMLVAAYHLLARHTTYHEPGADYYERRHADRVRHRAVQLLDALVGPHEDGLWDGEPQRSGGFRVDDQAQDTA
jgi:hypothetical protein